MSEDHDALHSLAIDYAAGVDRRHAELLLGVFHPDATLIVHRPDEGPGKRPHQMRGRSEIARVIDIVSRYPATFHMLGQGRYSVSGDTASGEVYCIANHFTRSKEGDSNFVMYIRYEDQYRRDASGAWKIERREVHSDWVENRV
jgi:ketosteroid isomerase-like protein